MLSLMTVVTSVLLVAASGAPAKPSVAVLGFSAKEGVPPQVADILTENTATLLRNSGRFSRVVSAADVTLLLSLEAQKQMLSCDSAGCVAEIAGALGTDLVCTGTAAQVGSITVLNARIVAARTGQTVASVGRNIPQGADKDAGVVLVALPEVIRELLAGVKDDVVARETAVPATPVRAETPSSPPEQATPATTDAAAPARSPLRFVGWGLAGVGGAAAGLLTLLGLVSLGTAAVMPLWTILVAGSDHYVGRLQTVFVGGLGVGAAMVVLVLLAVAVVAVGVVTALVVP